VADVARAAEVYARRQKLSADAIAYATAVKVDALTLMGEFLKAVPKQDGGDAQRTRFQKGTESPPPPTLAEIGIDKRESSDAQALATIRAEDPDLHEEVRAGKKTVAKARAEARRPRRKTPAAGTAPTAGAPSARGCSRTPRASGTPSAGGHAPPAAATFPPWGWRPQGGGWTLRAGHTSAEP
jgi:hypothetical protein